MRKIFIFITALLLTLAVTACSDDDKNKSDAAEETIDNAIISLPSCISASTDTARSVKISKSASAALDEVYEGIRENVGAIDRWTGTIKELLKDIYRLTGFGSSGDWSDNTPTAGDPVRVVWGPDTENGYTTKVELYWTGYSVKGFEAYVTINKKERTAKGIITWDFRYIDDPETANDNLIAQFIFDSTAEPKTLEVKATGMDNAGLAKEPDKGWVKATLDDSHVFTLWGNYYFQGIKLLDDSAAEDRNYVFAVAGYDEVGLNSGHINKAILNLSVPLAAQTDISDMWANDSIGEIFKYEICDRLKLIWIDALTTDTIGGMEAAIGLDISGNVGIGDATNIIDLTDDQVVAILEFVAASAPTNISAGDISNLLFVMDLVNPAYFDESGFVGTWDGSGGGTLTGVPSGFDGLSIGTVAEDVVAPADVLGLTVGFLGK